LAAGLISLLVAGGCKTSQAGTTDTMGRFDMVINAPPPRATRAAQEVLEDDYKFAIDSSALSTIDGKIEAHSAQDTKVWVWVERQGDDNSLVSIRIGMAGDEKLSLEILAKIRDQAKTLMQRLKEKM
jgi:hypothetical protein